MNDEVMQKLKKQKLKGEIVFPHYRLISHKRQIISP